MERMRIPAINEIVAKSKRPSVMGSTGKKNMESVAGFGGGESAGDAAGLATPS